MKQLNAQNTAETKISGLLTGKNRYALQVTGDTMIDIGIMNGDYVVVDSAATINNGDIVIALINGGKSHIARYYNYGFKVELHAENPKSRPVKLPSDAVKTQGKVVGVFRTY